MKKIAIVCLALLVAVTPVAAQAQDKQRANDLKQIGLAYHNYYDTNRKGPTKVEDLEPYYEKDKRITGLLNGGDIVFLYGADLLKQTEGTSKTVLAYEKQVPEKGG